MTSYSRFEDDEYKNWLKTTMSLQLLRSRLDGFIENETETYHNSLRNKLKEAICKNTCNIPKKCNRNKVSSVCPDCQLWIEEILKNHNNKNMEIYWNNCKPHLWSFNKWEVAKVYMPRGNKDHNAVGQFDFSAIVNLMIFCSHFKKFVKDQVLKEVTNVRNQMMHSPDMKVAKEAMKEHLKKILNCVGHLLVHIPELNELEKEINQLEEAELNIKLERQAGSRGDAMNLLNMQKMLDLEQQVMKEKIEHLASRLEEDKELNNEEYLKMKEFLDQNKDLLEELGPQMEKLNAIEAKVELHDQQLSVLAETVGQIVKKTEEPVFSADMVKYKNHLYEEAKKNKWPEPVFTEVRKTQGYIGRVEINGQTFTGRLVHPKVKAAHQEAAMIALEQMNMQPTEEGSLTRSDRSASPSAANSLFFVAVKVPMKTDFLGPEAESSEAAVLEAYKSLERALNLGDAGAGSPPEGARQRVHDFFSQAGCGTPAERNRTHDGKFWSQLCINEDLTFQNPEGMSKKLHAEQAAAKEALLRLAGVLGWDLVGVNENYKGRLQEILVKQGYPPPSYQRIEPSNRGAESEKSLPSVPILQATESISNIESPARTCFDSGPYPTQLQKPQIQTPAPVIVTVPDSERNLLQSSNTDVLMENCDSAAGQTIAPAVSIDSSESSVSSGPPFFAAVKVPVKTDFQGPEAESSEAAVLEAYKSLERALNLGDAGAGSPPEGARQRVHDFFSQAGCGPPAERISTTDGKFRLQLCINGDLTFQNPEGMSKKLHAEQAAAKEALLWLAGVLGWDLVGVNENYKGRLQEILVKQGYPPPSYQRIEPSNRGAESEKSLPSVPILQATESISNIESPARTCFDSGPYPTQLQKPQIETPAPVIVTVPDSERNLLQSSNTDVLMENCDSAAGQTIAPAVSIDSSESSVSSGPPFFAAVKVTVKTDFQGPEAESSEAAVLEAYKSLERALNLGDAGAGSPPEGARQRVHDFFSQAGCGPPAERISTTDGKFRSQLCINGDLTFQNPEGMSKKLHAEQAAAKEALLRLAGVLGWDLVGGNENYKGRLQEILVKQGYKPPSYQQVSQQSHTEPSNRGAACETSGADVSIPPCTETVSTVQTLKKPSADQTQLLPDRKKPKQDYQDIGRILKMFGLQPPSATFESLSVKENVLLTVEINLDDFTYANQQGYPGKKDAIRKTYLKFGQAIGICEPSTDESSKVVKQHFSQKSLSLPTEEVVEKEKKFFCSLKVPSYRFSYEGQGESEEAARQEAFTLALSGLSLLFDYNLTCCSVEAEERLTLLLQNAHQGPPALQKPDTQYKATGQLNLKDFTLEGKGQNTKKSAQSQLCRQILMLLGEKETTGTETKKPVSERNRVDEWFTQKRLPLPVFEDTKESAPEKKDVFRMKATFSGCVTCTHPDWQASEKEAVGKLMRDLSMRFQDG